MSLLKIITNLKNTNNNYSNEKIDIEKQYNGFIEQFLLKIGDRYLKKYNYDSQGGSYDIAMYYTLEDANKHKEQVINGFIDLEGKHTGKTIKEKID